MQFLVTATVAEGRKRLSDTPRTCRKFSVFAANDLTGTLNTGDIKMGQSSEENEQPLTLGPGDERTWSAADGGRLDLSQWYFAVATDDDGLVVITQ